MFHFAFFCPHGYSSVGILLTRKAKDIEMSLTLFTLCSSSLVSFCYKCITGMIALRCCLLQWSMPFSLRLWFSSWCEWRGVMTVWSVAIIPRLPSLSLVIAFLWFCGIDLSFHSGELVIFYKAKKINYITGLYLYLLFSSVVNTLQK